MWTFSNRRSGYSPEPAPALWRWEVAGDPISDNYIPEEINAVDLLQLWVKGYYPDQSAERLYGPGMVSIHWLTDIGRMFEAADFTADVYGPNDETFLSHFTYPRHVHTGEQINWNRVPVVDKLWDEDHGDKGGFFQTATGWKPSPLPAGRVHPRSLQGSWLGRPSAVHAENTRGCSLVKHGDIPRIPEDSRSGLSISLPGAQHLEVGRASRHEE